jgi:hypothetical protein
MLISKNTALLFKDKQFHYNQHPAVVSVSGNERMSIRYYCSCLVIPTPDPKCSGQPVSMTGRSLDTVHRGGRGHHVSRPRWSLHLVHCETTDLGQSIWNLIEISIVSGKPIGRMGKKKKNHG